MGHDTHPSDLSRLPKDDLKFGGPKMGVPLKNHPFIYRWILNQKSPSYWLLGKKSHGYRDPHLAGLSIHPGAYQLQGGLLERVPEGCSRGTDGLRQGLRAAAEGDGNGQLGKLGKPEDLVGLIVIL